MEIMNLKINGTYCNTAFVPYLTLLLLHHLHVFFYPVIYSDDSNKTGELLSS